jgi:predicted transcriptional regulator
VSNELLIFKEDRSHYRSKPDVTADILRAVSEKPAGKTRVTFLAFLSSTQVREYLVELVTKGMLSYDDKTRSYKTTRQGLEYLRLYEAMRKL